MRVQVKQDGDVRRWRLSPPASTFWIPYSRAGKINIAYIRIRGNNRLAAIDEAKRLIAGPHVIYIDGIVEY